MNKKSTVQPLSENTRKAIIIAAIVVVAVIILSVALALILKPTTLTPDDGSNSGGGSSSLTIRNGDFEYVKSDDTAYPKTADNWTSYGFSKIKDGSSSHGFEAINDNAEAEMGIVDVSAEGWKELEAALPSNMHIQNPGLHEGIKDGKDENDNVYMIATKQPTAASILSDSVSVPSGASVLITIWLNTAQLVEGSKAVVMIQKSASTTTYAKADNWYAYDFEIDQSSSYEKYENGWQKLEFYIFNRDAGTKYIRVSIGIGNVYSGEKNDNVDFSKYKDEPIKGEGVLFIDDITYETKTANDYRFTVDNDPDQKSTLYKIIDNEDIQEASQYLTLVEESTDDWGKADWGKNTSMDTYTNSEDYVNDKDAGAGYSPFTNRDDFKDGETGFTIYKLSHNGTSTKVMKGDKEYYYTVGMRLAVDINVKSSLLLKDHHHISFWVRVSAQNKVAYGDIFVQRKSDGEWKDIDSGSWTLIQAVENIEEDTNCGWVKYDIYLKPSAINEEISILYTLGPKTYTADEKLGLFPNGSLYVTSPAYEKISYTDYNSASSSTTKVRKINLIGTADTTTITNGTFSSLDSSGQQPASWTQAFGGDNAIYKDGLGNIGIVDKDLRLASVVANSGVVQHYEKTVKSVSGKDLDIDDQQNVLKISNSVATSFGYYSTDITLSAHKVYAFGVMFRPDDENPTANPYVYLLDTDTDKARDERIITSVTTTAQKESDIDASLFGYGYKNNEIADGWARYYMIVVTGNESMTVRLALFNGSIDGSVTQQGTVYYDLAEMKEIGGYALVEDEDAEEGSEEAKYYNVEWDELKYTDDTTLYGETLEDLFNKTLDDEQLLLDSWGIVKDEQLHQPTEAEWEEMKLIPEKEDDDNNNDDNDKTPSTPRDVDWGLLFSVISSVALVAAMLVVFVVRIYKNKGGKKPKAA